MGDDGDAIALGDAGGGSVGDENSGRGGEDFYGGTVGVFKVKNATEELARNDGGGEIGDGFEKSGEGGEAVVVAMEGLDPAGGLKAGDGGAFQEAEVTEDVREAGLGEAVDEGGDGFAAAEFGGDDEFALAFGFRGEKASAGDVGVEKTKLGEEGFSGGELGGVIDHVGVSARYEIQAAAAGVEVDDDVGEREEN